MASFWYTVNPATGTATQTGGDPTTSGPYITGLAIRGSSGVPEPSGLVLALVGSLMLVGTTRVWHSRGTNLRVIRPPKTR